MNPKVDFFFNKASQWSEAFEIMRQIALDCGLIEELKWGCPCYTYNKKNVVLIHGFKQYCAFLFFKGALMKDPDKLLIQQTEQVQSARQIRFTSTKEISKIKAALKAYIFEAIEIEKSGLKVAPKKTSDYPVPEEFETALKASARLKKAFAALTPGRQRAYLFYFGQAKQSKTRVARVTQHIPRILEGKGLDDA
ncbi:YdeI family protein [Niabella terrae]